MLREPDPPIVTLIPRPEPAPSGLAPAPETATAVLAIGTDPPIAISGKIGRNGPFDFWIFDWLIFDTGTAQGRRFLPAAGSGDSADRYRG